MRELGVELMPSRSASVTVEACPSGPHAARQRVPQLSRQNFSGLPVARDHSTVGEGNRLKRLISASSPGRHFEIRRVDSRT